MTGLRKGYYYFENRNEQKCTVLSLNLQLNEMDNPAVEEFNLSLRICAESGLATLHRKEGSFSIELPSFLQFGSFAAGWISIICI